MSDITVEVATQSAVTVTVQPTGARGMAGADGSDGADGATGADGRSAYQVAVDAGFVGTEAQWLASLKGVDGTDGVNGTDGDDGKSAYAVAVDNGFLGSESEWLASLQGPKGDTGDITPELTAARDDAVAAAASAGASESNAASSATSAGVSASQAVTSAGSALDSATAATSSATAASASASDAASSASGASSSAASAASSAAAVEGALDDTVVGGTLAAGELALTTHAGGTIPLGAVGKPIQHIYQLEDLQDISEAGPAIFHFDPDTTYTPPLPSGGLDIFGGLPQELPGFISVTDADTLIPGVTIVEFRGGFSNSAGAQTLIGTVYKNYEGGDAWSSVPTELPAIPGAGYVLYSDTGEAWGTYNIGDIAKVAKYDSGGQINGPAGGPTNVLNYITKLFADGVYAQTATFTTFNASTFGATLDLRTNRAWAINMNANWTISSLLVPTATSTSTTLQSVLVLTQDATGSRTLTLPASVQKAPGFALSTAPNSVDLVTLTWMGSAGVYASIERLAVGQAVSAATAGALMLRDNSGRAQVATPSASGDIATKGYVDGVKMPTGGSTGQVLKKSSGTDYATAWSADLAIALGSAMNPQTSATATRNSSLPKNFWQTSTQPVNWVDGDEWIKTS